MLSRSLPSVQAAAQRLKASGYVVLDGVLSNTASAFQSEIVHLYNTQKLQNNSTVLVRNGQSTLLEKDRVFEAELSLDKEVRRLAPTLAQLHEDNELRQCLADSLPELKIKSHAIKLQHTIGGGGCFPMHFDTDVCDASW